MALTNRHLTVLRWFAEREGWASIGTPLAGEACDLVDAGLLQEERWTRYIVHFCRITDSGRKAIEKADEG